MNRSFLDKNAQAQAVINHSEFCQLQRALARESNPNLRIRYEIISLYSEMPSVCKVSSRLNVDRKTVTKWIKRFSEQGLMGLNDLPRSGRRTSIDAEMQMRIISTIAQGVPPELKLNNWHAKALAAHLNLSYPALIRFLKRSKIKLGGDPEPKSLTY